MALPLQGGEVVLLNAHYLNASDTDLDAEVRLNLWYMDEPATVEASTLFFYDWAILVPKDGAAQPRMRCRIPSDINLIFGQSHMRRRGVGYGAYLSGGDGDATCQ